MSDITDQIRSLCALLMLARPDSAEAARYRSELKSATAVLVAQERNWNKASERDTHRDDSRQSYRSRETDSADGFAEGLTLFNPKKLDSGKKKND